MTLGTLWGTSVTLAVRHLRPRQVMCPAQYHTANVQQSWHWSTLGPEASVVSMGSKATLHVSEGFCLFLFIYLFLTVLSIQNSCPTQLTLLFYVTNRLQCFPNTGSITRAVSEWFIAAENPVLSSDRPLASSLKTTQLLPVHISFPCTGSFHSRFCA